jgi:hypothetical protein
VQRVCVGDAAQQKGVREREMVERDGEMVEGDG